MRGDRCADFLVRRRGGVIFGFGKIGSSGVGDASVLVGIDGGKGAELEAVDVGKDGGAARRCSCWRGGYRGYGGIVDSLGGLEGVAIGQKGSLEIESIGFVELLGVRKAEGSARGRDG